MEDMDGGTFTISNGGVFGSMFGTPIINPPQSAILGMHGIFDRPVAVGGKVCFLMFYENTEVQSSLRIDSWRTRCILAVEIKIQSSNIIGNNFPYPNIANYIAHVFQKMVSSIAFLSGGDPSHDVCRPDVRPSSDRWKRSSYFPAQDQVGGRGPQGAAP